MKISVKDDVLVLNMWSRKNGGIIYWVREYQKMSRLCRDYFEFEFVYVELGLKLGYIGDVR